MGGFEDVFAGGKKADLDKVATEDSVLMITGEICNDMRNQILYNTCTDASDAMHVRNTDPGAKRSFNCQVKSQSFRKSGWQSFKFFKDRETGRKFN